MTMIRMPPSPHRKNRIKATDLIEDPVYFSRMCWPQITLYDKQVEVLTSLRDNVETFVHAANETGKDFIAAIAVVWFFYSRQPARVITSSSGETQLKSILWSEIKERVSSSRIDLGFKVGSLSIHRNLSNGQPDELSYVIGHVTKTVENFHGHHLPHDKPRVLAVFDEASGIGDAYDEASDSWMHRKLAIGNPMNTVNFFFRACKAGDEEDPAGSGGLLRKVIHMDGEDSPNVQLGRHLESKGIPGPYPSIIPGVLSYDEFLRRTQKWDKIKQHIRLRGLFWEGEGSLWFPPDWLDASEAAYRLLCPNGYEKSYKSRPARAMGIDCGAGRDLSVWTIIDRLGVLYQYAIPTPDTSEITNTTLRLMADFQVTQDRVCFDAGGGGKQIVDHLREKGYKKLRSIAFGSTPTPAVQNRKRRTKYETKVDQKEDQWVYKNKRAEMHGILRQWMDPSINETPFALPEELYQCREDLAILPMWFDEGKMFLPPKDRAPDKKENPDQITIKSLLGRSPDRGDSLVLAVYALDKKASVVTLGSMR